MQKKIKIVILIIVAIFGFCLVRDFLVKSLIGSVASNVTGAPTHIGGLSLSIIKQSVRISGFKMYNPRGFSRDILVDIPKIGVTCDMGALLKGKIHLKQLDIDLKELGLTKNKEGKLNVDSLKIIEDQKNKKKNDGQKPAKEIAIQIDAVNLHMGRVVNKDYSVKELPVIKVYDINLKKTYKNITSVQQLAVLIMAEPLKAAGIQGAIIYGVMMLTSVAALPVAAVFTFAGKDYAEADFDASWDLAYDIGLKQLQKAGKIKTQNKQNGVIDANVNGAGVTLKLKKVTNNKTHIVVSARKFGLPQPEISAGVLYRISDELK
ncbi:MAG: AsmA family protein [Candidatus Omnitrophota bacterium]|nr:AsmA family protein [Candidatus Omnitrophota bacterium]